MNNSNYKNTLSLVLALLSAWLVFCAYNSFVNKNVLRVLVNGVFEADTQIIYSSVSPNGAVTQLDTSTVAANPGQTPQLTGTKLLNAPLDRLRLEFRPARTSPAGDDAAARHYIAVHSVQISRPYTQNLFIGANRTKDVFDLSRSATGSNALLLAGSNANTLTSKTAITPPQYVKAWLLAGLFFSCLLFIFRNGNWREIPAIADMSLGRKISSAHEFGTINGLRGIAALLVLLSHTAPGFHALGVGLTMLFVISGFLLSKPFVLEPNRIFSFATIEAYITKRLKRILPMYYLYIFMVYVVSLQIDVALRHFLFVQAEGHLWPMTQIFSFYLLLPAVLLLTSVLLKFHLALAITALGGAAYFWWSHMTGWKPFFNGEYFHEFYLYAFLLGVAASYLHYGWLAGSTRMAEIFNRWRTPLAVVGLTTLVLTVAWSAPVKPPALIQPYISQFYMKCILCVVIILLALNVRASFYNKFISNWFFRSLGIVGFSFYILHGLGMQIVQQTQLQLFGLTPADRSWSFVAVSLLVTYAMSLITYSYVERPFFGFRARAKTTVN